MRKKPELTAKARQIQEELPKADPVRRLDLMGALMKTYEKILASIQAKKQPPAQ